MNLPQACRLKIMGSVASTNEEAKEMASSGAPSWSIICAKEQKMGKGRQGRNWISPPGNLYFSILLWPEENLGKLHQLSFVSAIAVKNALAEFLPKETKIEFKWPNDILAGGGKICGILLESGMVKGKRWLVIGVGINIRSFPEDIDYPATSLLKEGGLATLEEALEKAIAEIYRETNGFFAKGFVDYRKQWLQNAAGMGKQAVIKLPEGSEDGIMKGMNEEGYLLLEKNGRIKTISAGQLFF